MEFILSMSLDNEGAQHPDSIAELLRNVANRVQAGYGNGIIRDLNGNSIGTFSIRDASAGD